MTEEIHDMSRVNSFMASRRRAMIFHSVWKPMLAGAAGAALVVGAVWVATPKFVFHDIEVPRVTMKDITVDHVVPRDVPVDHVVPHDVPVDRLAPPAPAPKPVASAPPVVGPEAPYAAKTPDENKFVDKPEYKTAQYHGRIVKSVDGRALSFEDGKNFSPAKLDRSGKPVDDPDSANDSDELIGDLGMCVESEDPTDHGMWLCSAMHNGQEVPVKHKASASAGSPKLSPDTQADPPAKSAGGPTTAARSMVMVDVTVADYPVEAMVDTGCSWPMSVPKAYADALIRVGLATRAGSSPSMLADGSTQEVDVITIKLITVDGRTLHGVQASVAPSDTAPILLGLGALNRLGPYSIEEGRLVFTGEQPA